MGILATTTRPIKPFVSICQISCSDYSNSMSQDYQQGIFGFSNGFERSEAQIRRDNNNKVRLQQGFQEEEEAEGGGGGEIPVYETAGMLSEMFNFGPSTAELLETATFRSSSRQQQHQPQSTTDWYGNSNSNGNNRQGNNMMMVTGLVPLGDSKNQQQQQQHHNHNQISSINVADSAAAMHLFLMNPSNSHQTRSSPSPPPSSSHTASSSTHLHMLLPNASSNSLQGFHGSGGYGQFTWGQEGATTNHGENIGGSTTVVEGGQGQGQGQGLSLSLSSSLEAAKAEELRMGDTGFLYYNNNQGQGGGPSSFPYKNHQQILMNLQGTNMSMGNNHQGFGSSSSIGVVNVLRNSKYVKAAQELLQEFCNVGNGRGQFKKTKFNRQNSISNPNNGGSSSSSIDPSPIPLPLLSAADRIEHQRRKVKLLSMLDEACNLSLFLSHLQSFIKSQGPPNIFLFIYSD